MAIFLCKLNLQRASLHKTPPSHLCMLMVLPTTLAGHGTCYICSSCYNTIVKHHILAPFIICPFTYPSASMSRFTFASRCSNPAINCSLFCTQRYDQTLYPCLSFYRILKVLRYVHLDSLSSTSINTQTLVSARY